MDIEGAEVPLLEELFDRPNPVPRLEYLYAETHDRVIPENRPRVDTFYKRVSSHRGQPHVILYLH